MISLHEFNEAELDEFLDLVENWPDSPQVFILEEYRVYASVNHIGSKVYTVQVIGNIKRTARRCQSRIIEIPATTKKIAALWSGVKLPKGHLPDYLAAYLIGYWWLHKEGVIPPRVLEDL